MSARYLGLMSGTSVDTVDAAIVSFGPDCRSANVLHAGDHPIPRRLRRELLEAAADEQTTLARVAHLDTELGHLFADAALAAVRGAGLDPREIAAVGSHGQTVRHEPGGRWPATTQIGDPNVIAQRTGITTVADFRRRDVAAGGQGAPLAPAFHQAAMSRPGVRRAVVNLGGIANVSVLDAAGAERGDPLGFDCGPANGLLDAWARRHLDASFDEGGSWAAKGAVHAALLERMLADPYFSMPAPKSTGRGYFDEDWIDRQVRCVDERPTPADVQRTLCELCAATVARSIEDYGGGTQEVYLCGGGVHNRTLVARLVARLAPRPVARTDVLGLSADHVEAAAFAWFAKCALEGVPAGRPSVTGASEAVVLGGIYPGRGWPDSPRARAPR
ncbi:MAG: anhydro-N-acetylmuramic acid kinase [Immundisolibacterales bacterium]|nr:anhydro-N-acetylmuramic acid kinase [Immundisolibacterales bacterium]